MEKLEAMERDEQMKEEDVVIFKEVLGHRLGSTRGLGQIVMPETSKRIGPSLEVGGYLSQDAQYYKAQYEILQKLSQKQHAHA